MTVDHLGDRLHEFDLRAPQVAAPWIEQRVHAVRLLAIEDVARATRRHAESEANRRVAHHCLLIPSGPDRDLRRETALHRHLLQGRQLALSRRHQGRGKLDRFHRHAEPVKAIWVTPLQHDFRTHTHTHLCNR